MNEPVTRQKLFELMRLGPVWESREETAEASQASDEQEQVLSTPLESVADESQPEPVLSLEALAEQVSQCTACELACSRSQTVFSDGVPKAPLMVIGEAPGQDEDESGKPFVGRAGQLLERMLAAIGSGRQKNVYIGNVIKCRPPKNRDPRVDEIASCSGYLMDQIRLNEPKVLLLVGAVSIKTLLRTNEKVGDLRGRVHQVEVAGRSIPAVVSYHPAYLLRAPVQKAKAWDDLLLLQTLLAQTDG